MGNYLKKTHHIIIALLVCAVMLAETAIPAFALQADAVADIPVVPYTEYTVEQNDYINIYYEDDAYAVSSVSIDDVDIATATLYRSSGYIKIKGIKGGQTTLRIQTNQGEKTCAIIVESTFKFTQSEYSITRGNSTTLYLPYGFDEYKWSSSNPAVANVEKTSSYNYQRRINALGIGTAVITATNEFGEVATTTVTVTAKPFKFENYPSNYQIERDDYVTLSVSTGLGKYEWSVSDDSIIRLDDSYAAYTKKAVALNKGTAIVTVTNEYGESVSITLTVTASDFTIEGQTAPAISVETGSSVNLELPYGYYWDDCTYESENPELFTLDSSSSRYTYLKGVKAGDTTVTVTNKFGESVTCSVHVFAKLEDIGFTQDEYVVYMGQEFALPYFVEPADHNNKITFSVHSYYNDIISVSEDGVVTPLKPGIAYGVEIKGEGYGWYSDAECDIIVKEPYFSSESYNLYKNQTMQLELTGGRPDTVWTSSDPEVVSVDETGVITANKAGTVTITANSGGFEVAAIIKVTNPKLSKTTASVYAGKTLQLKVTGGVGTVKWTTSNKNIATVSNTGKITAKKAGKVTITANVSGMTLKCAVTVKGPELSVKKKTLIAKQTFKLTVNGATSKVTWSSSNKKVAKVSATGKITAVKAGTATIKAKVNGKTLSCKVTVKANQISYKVNLDVNQYPYGEPYVALKKAYYEGNTLKVDLWIINNKIFKCQKFDWIIYKLYDNKGKIIANKKFTNVKLNIPAGGVKKITLSFSGSALKQKNAILNNGVSDYWSYWFTYIIN